MLLFVTPTHWYIRKPNELIGSSRKFGETTPQFVVGTVEGRVDVVYVFPRKEYLATDCHDHVS